VTAESTVSGIISNAQTFAASETGKALDQAYYMQNATVATVPSNLKPLDISWTTNLPATPYPLKATDIDWNTFAYPIRDSGMSTTDVADLFRTLYHDLADGVPDTLDAQIEAWMDKYAPMPDPALMLAEDNWLLGVINGTQAIGLPTHVVDAMWAQSRDRELADGLRGEDKVMAQFASRGFSLPSGALSAQLAEAQQATQYKLSDNNRAITIESAKIAVEVQKFAISEITKLRLNIGKILVDLITAWLAMYKAPIDAAVAVVSAQAQLAGILSTYANANTARIKALADVEVQNRQVMEDNYKLEFMKNLEKYKAEVQGYAHNASAFASTAAAAISAQHSMGSINANESRSA